MLRHGQRLMMGMRAYANLLSSISQNVGQDSWRRMGGLVLLLATLLLRSVVRSAHLVEERCIICMTKVLPTFIYMVDRIKG